MSPPRRRLGAVGVLLLVVLALSPASASAGMTTPRLGSHSMIGPQMDPATIDALFKASHDAGLGIVRVDVLASWLFPTSPDAPDWTTLDTVRAAARAHHAQVLALLSAVPAWNARCPPLTEKWYRCPPGDDAAWARIVEQMAARAPEIRFWEVLNEANLVNPGTGRGEYFYGDAEEYARFLRVTSAALKRGNPRAKVVFTGVIEPYDAWLAKVLAQPGTVQAFDIANAHFRGGIGKLDDMVRAARAAFGRGGFQARCGSRRWAIRAISSSSGTRTTSGSTRRPPSPSRPAICTPRSGPCCAAAPGACSSRSATSTGSGGSSRPRACSTGPSRR